MNRQTAAFLKWAGILLIIGNVMAWEGMFLSRRWRARQGEGQARNLLEQYPDTACPEQKVIHTTCKPCGCRKKDKERVERELSEARLQRDTSQLAMAKQRDTLAALRAAAKQESNVRLANPEVVEKAVLVATPVKNAADKVPVYFNNLQKLTYPKDLMSLAFIVSDSLDPSARAVRNSVTALKGAYRRATVLQRDFGYQQAPDPNAVPTAEDEAYRRAILARSRNYLLFEALRDEGWVLWLDVDIVAYPVNLIEQLMSRPDTDIIATACVFVDDNGAPTEARCDGGAWAETEASRAYLKTLEDPHRPLFEDFQADQAFVGTRLRLSNESNAGKEAVPLDAVGTTSTLIESEGFGKMAVAAGYQPIGLPGVIVHHAAVHVQPQPTWR